MRISSKIQGMARVQNAVKRVEDACQPPSLTDSLGEGADIFVEGARSRAPKRSGRLAGSIDKAQTSPYGWQIGTNLIYAGVQEYGATIRPVSASTLVYQAGGTTWFDKIVHIRAQPYMAPTFEQDSPRVVEAVKDAIARKIG